MSLETLLDAPEGIALLEAFRDVSARLIALEKRPPDVPAKQPVTAPATA